MCFQNSFQVCFRKIEKSYYNLDSSLKNPDEIGDENKLIDCLTKLIGAQENQIFVVVDLETAENRSWFDDT